MLRFGDGCRQNGDYGIILRCVAEGASPRVEYACERCGGVAVTRDAWAEWHVQSQVWALSEVFDFAFCHQCHRETRLIERFAG
jgi:hypothetical protein